MDVGNIDVETCSECGGAVKARADKLLSIPHSFKINQYFDWRTHPNGQDILKHQSLFPLLQ